MQHLSPITLLPTEVAKLTGQPAPTYGLIRMLVIQGLIPAERLRGRWYFRGDKAVRKAAEALGVIRNAAA